MLKNIEKHDIYNFFIAEGYSTQFIVDQIKQIEDLIKNINNYELKMIKKNRPYELIITDEKNNKLYIYSK